MFRKFTNPINFTKSNSSLFRKYSQMTLPKVLEQRRPKESPQTDYSTLSNYKSFKVINTTFDLELEFDKRKVIGSVKYDLLALNSDSKIILDSSFIKINDIKVDGLKTDYKINDKVEPLGSSIEIFKPIESDLNYKILIDFETTEKSTAVQWLKTKKETTDASDYVFTQLEPIHARSLFPSFDTPSIKSTFDVTIKSKHPVVFSGLPISSSNIKNIYRFKQPIPIPSYLIGIASGNIISTKIGPRSTIYAEPELLQAAKDEFEQDVEKFIQIAENIITPYIWTDYDFLINPSSFPYGGMENPNITFVTPTLISYDKSQVDVIAHELAHSWSGNNVTNASWEHFYLNEGWTVYLERRITSTSIDGVLNEKFRHFQYIQGCNDLIESIKSLPKFEYSKLVQDLQKGKIDPDDTFSSVPYEKGANFLFHLETKLGGIKEFDPFIKFYFTKFSKQSIDTYQFLDSLFEFYSKDSIKLEILNNEIDWELWLFTPGLPPKAQFDTTLVDSVHDLVKEWVSKTSDLKTIEQFQKHFNVGTLKSSYESFSSPQKILFIDSLLDSIPNSTFWLDNQIASDSLIEIYTDLNESRNTEIIFRWFKLKLTSGKTQYHQDLADWLGTVGRMKYVRPSYRLLNKVNRELAVATFNKYKLLYHPIAANLVKKDLGL